MSNTKVISLGGSIIAPAEVDVSFLRSFRQLMEGHLEASPEHRLILVCGGGAPARRYQEAYGQILASGPRPPEPQAEAEARDWIGIAATRLNAELLRQLFAGYCTQAVVTNPQEVTLFPGRVLVAAGWKPGFSTDYDAVLLAERFQADTLLNLSDIPRVYDADPRTNPQARPLDRMDWEAFRSLVGDSWTPGQNVPFDAVATAYAARLGLKVIVAAGRDLENLRRLLAGEPFVGTVIGPD
jgi:uridylate kinase